VGSLNQATAYESPAHSSTGTRSESWSPPTAWKLPVSSSISLPDAGSFHPSLTVLLHYRSARCPVRGLQGGPCWFTRDSTCKLPQKRKKVNIVLKEVQVSDYPLKVEKSVRRKKKAKVKRQQKKGRDLVRRLLLKPTERWGLDWKERRKEKWRKKAVGSLREDGAGSFLFIVDLEESRTIHFK